MERLRSSAKKKKKSVLRKVIDFFVKSEYHAYLVGGYVRDSTLGRESIDIDVVVEGNAIAAARKLNEKIKGKIVAHVEFGTASINVDKLRVDLASARTEKYQSPAHLPHVFPSTIVEDLNRRDFTINAIAMSISRENFGEIFDPFEGLADIKRKLIRILHRNSFIDDPTRIFRALRYKNRFGFKLEDDTERLMREAVKEGMVKKLSGQRILNELNLIFAEDSYGETVNDLSYYGIFALKRSELRLMPASNSHAFYYLLSKLPRNSLPLSKKDKEIVDDFRNIDEMMVKLSKTTKKSMLYTILSPVAEEVTEAITLIKPELQERIKTFHALKRIKPFITGKDLRKYGFKPDKQYARILRKMFVLQIDKKLASRREAIEHLKTLRKK
ncbi:MAG: CCA tRNA nucleotidyltransferase [candidate division WOR-3 bacterium]|nr:MAG: CCA tRNA nucleotidyltransferase [candidate division WOR-3 bacterium]